MNTPTIQEYKIARDLFLDWYEFYDSHQQPRLTQTLILAAELAYKLRAREHNHPTTPESTP